MDSLKGALVLVIAAAATFALAAIAMRPAPAINGWRALRPGAMHWVALGLGTGLTLFMGYIRLFVGSSRSDAAQQMMILTGLIIAFGVLTMATGAAIIALRRRAIRWRGTTIAFVGPRGPETRDIATIEAVRPNFAGQIALRFTDGARLRLDPYATCAADLLDRIADSRRPAR